MGRDDAEATIERAMYDMVTADILVASDSSLSHVAALLRERGLARRVVGIGRNRNRLAKAKRCGAIDAAVKKYG